MIRAAIYLRRPAGHFGTDVELCRDLRQAAEGRGGVVVATYIDDDGATVRTRITQWKALLANLGGIDQVIIASAGDLPGRNVRDLLRILAMLRDHGVGLYFVRDDIDTRVGSAFTLLDIVEAHRRARLSWAIRLGQARCVAAGKIIGRPAIRPSVRTQIQAYLAGGAGLRSTARRFKVSPASVVNIRRSSMTILEAKTV
jgi:DNA invertase Pin-like site-specific DNA recombinase